jgi:hypothetical protein
MYNDYSKIFMKGLDNFIDKTKLFRFATWGLALGEITASESIRIQ